MRLILGDCLEVMPKLVDEGIKVDLVLTDLPYGTTACKWDMVIPFDSMWEYIHELSNPTTPVCLFGIEPFSSHLRLFNLKEYRYDWIWNKQIGGGIFARKYRPLNDYELISVFFKKNGQYYPIMEKAKRDRSFKRQTVNSNVYGFESKPNEYKDNGLRYPKKILNFNSQTGECNNINRVHPTQKPVELLEYLIKTYTNRGDIVLDFTMGSGSTGVACRNTNRNFIGIELNEDYYNIACDRINNYQERLV